MGWRHLAEVYHEIWAYAAIDLDYRRSLRKVGSNVRCVGVGGWCLCLCWWLGVRALFLRSRKRERRLDRGGCNTYRLPTSEYGVNDLARNETRRKVLTSEVHLYGWAYEVRANRDEPCGSPNPPEAMSRHCLGRAQC